MLMLTMSFRTRGRQVIEIVSEEDWVMSINVDGGDTLGMVICPRNMRPSRAHPDRSWRPYAEYLLRCTGLTHKVQLEEGELEDLLDDLTREFSHFGS